MDDFYWKRHPDGPFATLIRVATTYLHPEVDDLESLQRLAKLGDDPEMRVLRTSSGGLSPTPTRFPETTSSAMSSTTTAARRSSCCDSGETSTGTSRLAQAARPISPRFKPASP